MNLVVCVKQVPAPWTLKWDDAAGGFRKEGVEYIINPLDEYAVEEALRLKERTGGGKVTALTLGSAEADRVLRAVLELGVDEAARVTDALCDEGDTLATAAALAAAVKKIGPVDLVVCGNQAPDGDTGQVGAQLAARLGWPHVSFVKKVEEASASSVTVHRMLDNGHDVVQMSLPGLITVVKEINEPRLPSLKGKLRAKSVPIAVWSAADLGVDPQTVGKAGSGVVVKRMYKPPARPPGQKLSGTPEEQAATLVQKLREMKFL